MTYYKNRNKDNGNLKKNLKKLGTTLMLMPLLGMTSCCVCKKNVSSASIYQTPTLKLQAGVKVETIDGVYTPQTNEVWHSEMRYREMERRLIYATAR